MGTYLLVAGCQQSSVFTEYPLHDNSTPVARPRTLHLCKHPLICAHLLRVVEVNGTAGRVKSRFLALLQDTRQEFDLLVERNHHTDLWPPLHLLHGATPFKIVELDNVALHVRCQLVDVLGLEWKPPQPMYAANSSNEVAVAHVGQRAQMCLVPALVTDLSPCAHPVTGCLPLGWAILARHLDAIALEGRCVVADLLHIVIRRRLDVRGHGGGMTHLLRAATVLFGEGHGDREDGFAALPCLHRTRRERPALAHALHVVENRHARITSEHEITVVGVHYEIRGHGTLCRL